MYCFFAIFEVLERTNDQTNTTMTHLPTLQKAKELVTFEFYQTWVNKMQGNQEGDWITTHQMVKAYWFGGDTPKFSEWEKLTNHVFQSCIVIAMNETKK